MQLLANIQMKLNLQILNSYFIFFFMNISHLVNLLSFEQRFFGSINFE